MALATALLIGSMALKNITAQKAAKNEAKAITRQGEINAANKSKEIRAKAARVQGSFLNSGLTLEGTPMSSIQGIFSTGQEDIEQIIGNANTASKNIVSQARSKALSNIAGTAAGLDFGGGSSFGGHLDLGGELKGINVPFTGTKHSFSDGIIVPPTKPTRINF